MPNVVTYEKISRVVNATAAGTSAINGTGVDMQGFDSVTFYASFGALTSTQVTALRAEDSADNSSFTAIGVVGPPDTRARVGPMADTDGNKMLVLEVYRPLRRYVRCVVERGTANAVVDGVTAVQRSLKKAPPTNDTTVSAAATKLGV